MPGQDCRFRFGMGVNRLNYRVSVKHAAGEHQIFSETRDPGGLKERQWQDREVPVQNSDSDPFFLILEIDEHTGRQEDSAAWSHPHLVCKEVLDVRRPLLPDIVLISIDTLRWDHLSLYGYPRETSPNLDALATEGVVFENSFSTAPYTLPSHASMLTGLYPEEHGAGHSSAEAPLEQSVTTVAEVLRQAGYRTLGFTAGGSMTSRLGMHQGFEEWTERRKANLKSTLPAVFDALGRTGNQPFFLFLHTYDVHAPYEQPEAERFFSAGDSESGSKEDWARIRTMRYHRHHQLERFEGIEDVIAAYDSGIRFADSQLGVLFDYLKEIGSYDDALIIVTSDHGETLFERGRYFGHSHTLHDQEIRIPLIVRLPRAQITGRRLELVQVLDIAPMVLAQAGIEPPATLSGRSPFDFAEARSESRKIVRGEATTTGARYVRSREWKIISPTANYWNERRKRLFAESAERFSTEWQIFNLTRDPEETRNLSGRGDPLPPEVRKLIRSLHSIDPPGKSAATAPPPEGELAKSLRALGYLQ